MRDIHRFTGGIDYTLNIMMSVNVIMLNCFPRCRQPHALEVVWQRRNRRVATPVPAWEPGMAQPLEGVCAWPLPANVSVNVTLFRDARTHAYEPKEWTFVLEDVRRGVVF